MKHCISNSKSEFRKPWYIKQMYIPWWDTVLERYIAFTKFKFCRFWNKFIIWCVGTVKQIATSASWPPTSKSNTATVFGNRGITIAKPWICTSTFNRVGPWPISKRIVAWLKEKKQNLEFSVTELPEMHEKAYFNEFPIDNRIL